MATNQAQAKVQQEYDPWGKVRNGGISATSINFTGQRLDGTGLLYYHARMYDPVLGRFVSADSIIPGQSDTAGTANPQNLNRYSYVNNNPVNRTDPSGHCIFVVADTIACAAAVAAAAEFVLTVIAGAVVIDGAINIIEDATTPDSVPAAPEAGPTTTDSAPAAPDAGPTSSTEEDKLYSRGGFRKKAVEDAEAAAPRNKDGEMICPTCGKVIPEKVTVDTKNGPVERGVFLSIETGAI